MHVHIGDLEIGTHWTKLNLLHNIRVYMIMWICSSCNNSQNSENLLNCLWFHTEHFCSFHCESMHIFTRTWIWHRLSFFFCIYTKGSLFKGTLLLHGNIYLPFLSFTLRSRGRYVFTTRQFNRFFSLSPPIYPVGPSQLKKQNHISKPLLHHLVSETPAGNTHFTYPKWGVLKETDSRSLIYCPLFHSIRVLKPCLGGWLSHCQEAEARNRGVQEGDINARY